MLLADFLLLNLFFTKTDLSLSFPVELSLDLRLKVQTVFLVNEPLSFYFYRELILNLEDNLMSYFDEFFILIGRGEIWAD